MINGLLTGREMYNLRRARDLADEAERLRENLKEAELRTISSPNMDGMPHGNGDGDAIARQVMSKDRIAEKLRRTEQALKRSRSAGRKALKRLKTEKRMFYEAYYIEAATFADAIAYARICKRTGEDYRAEVNKG